ncbi:polysaccharide deacetylase family protein [Candidatus Nitrosocosmicus arcticus]|uniref:Putative polysacchide deacetylase n=1 Tax=Candidatus Nitrosocosmicus arcticus TaxID=2035267 RepID=A0A557SUX9_9ARCH|nr:polysaccharide deacetylase family protein [Candidatus Nitrosocosmicus arcticus]TVP40410.1 putative polysacchide deacetylase [Candidatus Nitrosocosmicus arcticus]
MGFILTFVQMLVITFAVYTIASNDAFGYSIPEEMDYSVPFDFLSSAEDDSLDVNNSLNETKSIGPKIDDTYLAGEVDSDIFIERETARVKNNDHSYYAYDKDLENENALSKLYESESTDTKKNSNLQMHAYKNKYADKNDELKSENMKKSSKIRINDGKIAIINFDDNWKGQYENTKAILDEYQFKSTFYVVCDYVGGKNRLTWQQIQNLQEEGHEVGSHTMNHENLDKITHDIKYKEIVQSKKCIEDNGFKVNSFSYPFNSGDDNQETLELVSNTYDFARTAGGHAGSDHIGNYKGYERYTIVGWSHDAERKENNYSDLQMLDEFKDYVNQYDKKNPNVGSIPIIIYHNIDDNKEAYSTSIDLFRSEMRYLYESGFRVVTMNEVYGQN